MIKKYFDSHAHLNDNAFDSDREEVIGEIGKSELIGFVEVSSNPDSNEKGRFLAGKYPFIYCTTGIHPSDCLDLNDGYIDRIRDYYGYEKCVAIGEIGLDYHYDDVPRDIQIKWFEKQCILAKELDAPVIIHDREAHEDSFNMVKKYGNRGVFHCYSGSAEMAKELVKLGFYISFTGVLTFKNAKKAIQACIEVPLDRLMIETDCPYMAPEPFRGTRNSPLYVSRICEKMAEIKGLSTDEMAEITYNNAKRLFGIKDEKI